MPDSGFISDADMANMEAQQAPAPTTQPQQNTGYISDEDMAKMPADSDKYDTLPQHVLGNVENFARAGTLGASDLAETGLLGQSQEDVRGRENALSMPEKIASGIAGGATLIGLTGGLGAPLEAAMGGGYGAAALGYGAEGALFGAGNVVSDASLGDPNLNAEKIISEVGFGAALGGGLGILGRALKGAPELPGSILEPGSGPTSPPGTGGASNPIMTDPMPPKEPIGSFAALEKRNANSIANGQSVEMPQKQALTEALSRLPDLENQILPQQIESLSSHGANQDYQILRDSPNKVGAEIKNTEGLQKQELTSKIDSTISDLHPDGAPTSDPVQAGNRANEIFTNQYQQEQAELRPFYDATDKLILGPASGDIAPLVNEFSKAVPGVARMFGYGDVGELENVLPYDSKWGIDKSTYNAVKDVFDSLKASGDENSSFSELKNLRQGMSQNVNTLDQGAGPGQIRALKAAFMNYNQNVLEDAIPQDATIQSGEGTMNLRDVAKRYAINEQQRDVIEKNFGASVGRQEYGAISKVKPEDILDNMFKDTATTTAAKNILSPDDFNELLSDHLAHNRGLVTKNNVFSSNKFASFLKRHQSELGAAFSDNPETLQRLKDLSTVSTIVPDNASINPGGTAKTFIGMLKNMGTADLFIGLHNLPALVGKKTMEILNEARATRNAVNEFNQGLAGQSAKQARLQQTSKILSQVDNAMNKGAAAIFSQRGKNGQAP